MTPLKTHSVVMITLIQSRTQPNLNPKIYIRLSTQKLGKDRLCAYFQDRLREISSLDTEPK